MIMENKDLEKLLRMTMSVNKAGIDAPDPSLVFEARKKIQARRRTTFELHDFITLVLNFFRQELRVYHLGLTILVIFVGMFYVNEPNYNSGTTSGIHYDDALSIKNSTVSVNSSTMLTSIPTLVIRN
jgi:hypothetical protein